MNQVNPKYSLINLIMGFFLGLYFIFKGVTINFSPSCENWTEPITYDYVYLITIFCKSGFFQVVGILVVLGGLLTIIPKCRVIGCFILLPISLNLFLFQLMINNNPKELLSIGVVLGVNLIILFYHEKKWLPAFS